jgi:hypothetical protein
MTHITMGTTVRGPISLYNNEMQLETLVDKHMIVLQIQGALAMCLYTGTDDGSFSNRAGYVAFPTESNTLAGWKANGKFYCDATKLCSVPVALLQAEGRVSTKLLAKLSEKVVSPEVAKRRKITPYTPSAPERVTGVNRQVKAGITLR